MVLPRWVNEQFCRNPEGGNTGPTVLGVQLKYISLIVLAVQNATLSIVMHYSRISTPTSKAYSAASAVLLTELLKCSMSYLLALYNGRGSLQDRIRSSIKDIFSSDCWKLCIPAILYVIQNNLQYTAISNLSAATFQVAYQMKILTTALFSVLLLKKSLSKSRWMALVLLSIGVGIVQVQAGKAQSHSSTIKEGMNPMKGFMAVCAACFTSGLAGVYFEMVLKNNKNPKSTPNASTDLWTRNVQLSLFSLPPAILPVLLQQSNGSLPIVITPGYIITSLAPKKLLHNFTPSAYFTVLIQTFGGLLTALVIKYSDNIVKGFATSLAIVLSFLASVILFDFEMSAGFSLGAAIVLWATALYNRGEAVRPSTPYPTNTTVEEKVIANHSYSSSGEDQWSDEKRIRTGITSPRLSSRPPSIYFDEERERSLESQDYYPTSPSGYAPYSNNTSPMPMTRSAPALYQSAAYR